MDVIERTRDRCDVFPRGYLPMDCPACGRRRLEYGINSDGGVIYVECEKCGAHSDDDTLGSPNGAAIEQRLRLAIDPYGERPVDDLDMLIWRAGRMREHIDSAHHWLDMKGAPREMADGELTLRGRMDALDAAAVDASMTRGMET
jgi:hypothetical protein